MPLVIKSESYKKAAAVKPEQMLKHLVRLLPLEKAERDRYLTTFIAVISQEILVSELKGDAVSRYNLERCLEVIKPQIKSKTLMREYNRLEYLLYASLGKKTELRKVFSSLDRQERLEHLKYFIKHASWHRDEFQREVIEEELESSVLRGAESCPERKSISDLYKAANTARLYNTVSFLPVSLSKARIILVREITDKKELIKLARVAKSWQKKIETAEIVGSLPAAKVSKCKQLKLIDSSGVIKGIVEDIDSAVGGKLTSDAHIYLALDRKKRPQGVAIAIDNLEEAYVQLDALAINPDNLGVIKQPSLFGVGTALVKQVVSDALGKKVSRVILESTESAYSWYITKFGFKTTDEDPVYGDETVLELDKEGMAALTNAK